MIELFHQMSNECSAAITKRYSTSFAGAIRLLHKDLRQPIYNIYGFVRLADEIVDTFHDYDKEKLLTRFVADTKQALEDGISLNPILHSFQQTVWQYTIPQCLIDAFLHSMELDLQKQAYNTTAELDEYIYGSAEVVGLMCLYVFCEGDAVQYEGLKAAASKLGAAFQKINFLRDIQADYLGLSRTYFPGFDFHRFDAACKDGIEADIAKDFKDGLEGIRRLPLKARSGVYTAYRYYFALFKKIQKMQPQKVLEQRVRVPDFQKLFIVMQAGMTHRLNLI